MVKMFGNNNFRYIFQGDNYDIEVQISLKYTANQMMIGQ